MSKAKMVCLAVEAVILLGAPLLVAGKDVLWTHYFGFAAALSVSWYLLFQFYFNDDRKPDVPKAEAETDPAAPVIQRTDQIIYSEAEVMQMRPASASRPVAAEPEVMRAAVAEPVQGKPVNQEPVSSQQASSPHQAANDPTDGGR